MISTDKYIGLQFQDHGRDFNGVDCWGLVYLVYRFEFGIKLPSYNADYEFSCGVPLDSVQHCFHGWRKVVKTVKPGDLVLFEIKGGFHVGIVMDEKATKMMHVTKGRRVTVEKIDSMIWRNSFRGFWHYDGC